MGLRGPQPGTMTGRDNYGKGRKKEFSERLIQFPVSVKAKYLKEAQKEVQELIKKYRA